LILLFIHPWLILGVGVDRPRGLIAGVAVGLLIGALVDLLATKSWPRDSARSDHGEVQPMRRPSRPPWR
jgi:hypothetical protein